MSPERIYALRMQLTEVLFTTESRERADAFAGHLGEIGYDARVMPGDGSGMVWQIGAVEQPIREFDDETEFHRFLDETLQPLAARFDAQLAGGNLGDFRTFSIATSQARPDDWDPSRKPWE
jgi:hypothetical protein